MCSVPFWRQHSYGNMDRFLVFLFLFLSSVSAKTHGWKIERVWDRVVGGTCAEAGDGAFGGVVVMVMIVMLVTLVILRKLGTAGVTYINLLHYRFFLLLFLACTLPAAFLFLP